MEDDKGQQSIEQAQNSWYPLGRASISPSNHYHSFDDDDNEIEDSTSENTFQSPYESHQFQQLKQRMLEDFKCWLDQLEEEELTQIEEVKSLDVNQPDLQDFFRELTALRQEVRLQSKANQTIGKNINELSSTLEGRLDNSIRNVTNAVTDIKRQVPEARRDAQRGIAIEFLSIVEGLERFVDSISINRIPSLMFGKVHKKRFIEDTMRPHKLLLSKALDSMLRLKIRKIAAIGDEFDPKWMRVVGTTQDTGAKAGTITEVCLQGYLIEDSLIRTAEVKVEK